MRWPAAALLALALAGALGPAAPATARATARAPVRAPLTAANPDGAPVDRTIIDSRITESSGLAPSLLHPGVLWTHNDSGNPPRIYAIGRDGRTEATLTLRDEPDVDWEAIAAVRVPAGTGAPGGSLIAVGDLGDNRASRPSVRIAIVPEPARLRTASVTPVRVLRLRYPNGPRDAETLLADPRTGRFYIVSKTLFGAQLFAVPPQLWPGTAGSRPRVSPLTTLTLVATLSASFLTDGAFLPDGRLLLRGYDLVYVMGSPATARNGRLATLAVASLPQQDQGESIAVIDGGREALIGSEGSHEPVLRIAVPPVPGDASGTPAATPSGSPAPSSSAALASPAISGPTAGSSPASPAPSSGGSGRVWIGAAGAGLAVVALASLGLAFWPRPRRRSAAGR